MAKDVTTTLITYGDVDKAVADGLDKAFEAIGVNVVTQAKSAVPVKDGILGASIMMVSPLDPNYGYMVPAQGKAPEGPVDKLGIKPEEHTVYVGSAVEYAAYQEFGTRNIPASPYLRPAIQIAAGHGKSKEIIAKYNAVEVRNKIRRQFGKEDIL